MPLDRGTRGTDPARIKPPPKKRPKPPPIRQIVGSWQPPALKDAPVIVPRTDIRPPDTIERAKEARAANVKRGARPTGGPGKAEVAKATKAVTRAVKQPTGKHVSELQRQMVQAGFAVDVDGIWGPQSEKAWLQFSGTLNAAATDVAKRERKQAVADIRQRVRRALVNPPSVTADEKLFLFGFQGAAEIDRAYRESIEELSTQRLAAVKPKVWGSLGMEPVQIVDPSVPGGVRYTVREKFGWKDNPLLKNRPTREQALEKATGDQMMRELAPALEGVPRLQYLTGASELIAGQEIPRLLRGEDFHTGILALEVASFLPFLRGPKAIAQAVRAARDGGEAVEVARYARAAKLVDFYSRKQRLPRGATRAQLDEAAKIVQEAEQIPTTLGRAVKSFRAQMRQPGPILTGTARAVGRVRTARQRPLSHLALEVNVPQAQSFTGSVVEDLIDAARPTISKGGFNPIKTPEGRVGEELGRSLRIGERIDTAAATALKKVGRQLDPAEGYALRLLAEQSQGGLTIEERIVFHTEQAMQSTDPKQTVYHAVHADLITRASQLLDEAEDGTLAITPKAKKRLREAWGLLQETTGKREELYKQLGRLTDEQITARVNAPGRVVKGAKYQTFEAQIAADLKASTQRAAVHQLVDVVMAEQPLAGESYKQLLDSAARAFAHRRNEKYLLREIARVEQQLQQPQLIAEGPEEARRLFDQLDELQMMLRDGPVKASDFYDRLAGTSMRAPEDGMDALFQSEGGVHELTGFRSTLVDAIVAKMPEKASAQQIEGILKSAGVKEEEIEWSGLREFLAGSRLTDKEIFDVEQAAYDPEVARSLGHDAAEYRVKEAIEQAERARRLDPQPRKSYTREEVLSWLDQNQLKVEERVADQPNAVGVTDEERRTRFGQYALDEAEQHDYREILIRLPADKYGRMYTYESHWPDDQNVLLHIRATDRLTTTAADPDPKRTFFVEEIQSDWHQAAQKQGYLDPNRDMLADPQIQRILGEFSDVRAQHDALLAAHPELKPQFRFWTIAPAFRDVIEPTRIAGMDTGWELALVDPYAVKQNLRSIQQIVESMTKRFETLDSPTTPGMFRLRETWEDARGEKYVGAMGDVDVSREDADKFVAMINGKTEALYSAPREDGTILQADDLRAHYRIWVELERLGSKAGAHYDDLRRLHDLGTNKGVANAPFKKTWHELGVKRALAWAAENGYERMAWTTGRTQSERYDLANFVDRIEITPKRYDEYQARSDAEAEYDRQWEQIYEDFEGPGTYPDQDDYRWDTDEWEVLRPDELRAADQPADDFYYAIIRAADEEDVFAAGLLRRHAVPFGPDWPTGRGLFLSEATQSRYWAFRAIDELRELGEASDVAIVRIPKSQLSEDGLQGSRQGLRDSGGPLYFVDNDLENGQVDWRSHEIAESAYYEERDEAYEEFKREWLDDRTQQIMDEYDSGELELEIRKVDGSWESLTVEEGEDLSDYIGRTLADRYENEGVTVFEGETMMVGENSAEAIAMSKFYDGKIRSFTEKYLKPHGVRVETAEIAPAPAPFEIRVVTHDIDDPTPFVIDMGQGAGNPQFASYFDALGYQHNEFGDIPMPHLVLAMSKQDAERGNWLAEIVDGERIPGPKAEALGEATISGEPRIPSDQAIANGGGGYYVAWNNAPKGISHLNGDQAPGDFLWGNKVWGSYSSEEDAMYDVRRTLATYEARAKKGAAVGTEVHSVDVDENVAAFILAGQKLFQRGGVIRRTEEEVKARIEELHAFIDPRVTQITRYLESSGQQTRAARDQRVRRVQRNPRATHDIGGGEYVDTSEWKPIRERTGAEARQHTRERAEEILWKHSRNSQDPHLQKVAAALAELDELNDLVARNYDPDVIFGDAVAPGWDKVQVRGAVSFRPEDGRAILHAVEGAADMSTLIHETGHLLRRYALTRYDEDVAARWAGAVRDADGRWTWTVEAEEKFARGFEQYVREGRAPGGVGLRNAFRRLAQLLTDIYRAMIDDLPDLNPQMRELFDRLLRYEKKRGGSLVGAEDFEGGVNYVPYLRGTPIPRGEGYKIAGAYVRQLGRMFGGGSRSAIGGGPDDRALSHAFTGALMQTGAFKIDVAEASADALMTAARLSAAHRAREALLAGSTELPTYVDDVAIKVDPRINLSEDARRMWDEYDGAAMREDGSLSRADVERMDFNLSEEIRKQVLPEEIDGVPTRLHAATLIDRMTEVRKHLIEIGVRDSDEMAREILDQVEPIDNVRWVSRDMLDKSGLITPPGASRWVAQGHGRKRRGAAKAGWLTVDAFNDITKAAILYLNPGYYVNNLVGNGFMNLVQQGPLALVNLPRAARLHWELSTKERALIDLLMGRGAVGAAELRLGPKALTDSLAHHVNTVVDLIPRRAAFLHETRPFVQEGESWADGLKRMLNDDSEEGRALLEHVTRRAVDAIVDYERLSPFERSLTRWIFFYPWLKGATRWTSRFVAEHPVQATITALLLEHGMTVANEQLGTRPAYTQFNFPISTETLGLRYPLVGGEIVTLSDLVGEHQWFDGGLPMTMNTRQIFTWMTPIELAQVIKGTIVGDPEWQAIQNLTPFMYAFGTALVGYDPFRHRELTGPLWEKVYGQAFEGLPPQRIYDSLTMTPEERERRNAVSVLPRSRTWDLARRFGGSLAPAPFSRENAAALLKKALPAGEKKLALELEASEAFAKAQGIRVPVEIIGILKWRRDLEQTMAELKKESADGKLTKEQRAVVTADFFVRLYPDADEGVREAIEEARAEANETGLPDPWERLQADLYDEAMYDYRQWKEEVDDWHEEQVVRRHQAGRG